MIIVGILLVALLVISDGATVRNEFVISDCNCDDNSEVFDTTIDNRGRVGATRPLLSMILHN